MPYFGLLPAVTLVCVLAAAVIFMRTDIDVRARCLLLVLVWLTASSTELGHPVFAVPFALSMAICTALLLAGSRKPLLMTGAVVVAAGCLLSGIHIEGESDAYVGHLRHDGHGGAGGFRAWVRR
jgi:hypothetical protein